MGTAVVHGKESEFRTEPVALCRLFLAEGAFSDATFACEVCQQRVDQLQIINSSSVKSKRLRSTLETIIIIYHYH